MFITAKRASYLTEAGRRKQVYERYKVYFDKIKEEADKGEDTLIIPGVRESKNWFEQFRFIFNSYGYDIEWNDNNRNLPEKFYEADLTISWTVDNKI